MFGPSSINNRVISIASLIWGIPVFIMVLFITAGLMNSPIMKRVLFIDQMNNALSDIKAETIIELMGWENPYFNQVLPKSHQRISFSKLALQTVTHINLEDERSLLGNELPGFSLFDTTIAVAGEGTNYTNVPEDSPPPINYVLKQQQSSANGENGTGTDSKNTSPPPTDVGNAEVFIYSTHSWENYLPLLGLTGNKDANKAVGSGAPNQGVHLVDTWLKEALATNGIGANVNYQDAATVLNQKNWNTNQAYDASRPLVEDALKSGKPYHLFIDIHRDSSRRNLTTVQINNQSYARLSLVIGQGDPHYQENEAVERKINSALNANYPGLSRGIFEKSTSEGNGVYNQDISSHAILIEIGGVDNNETELKNTTNALGKIISQYLSKN
jgi:stage II sporulation protein P